MAAQEHFFRLKYLVVVGLLVGTFLFITACGTTDNTNIDEEKTQLEGMEDSIETENNDETEMDFFPDEEYEDDLVEESEDDPTEDENKKDVIVFEETWFMTYTYFSGDDGSAVQMTWNEWINEDGIFYVGVSINDVEWLNFFSDSYEENRDGSYTYSDDMGRGTLQYFPEDGNDLVLNYDGNTVTCYPVDESGYDEALENLDDRTEDTGTVPPDHNTAYDTWYEDINKFMGPDDCMVVVELEYDSYDSKNGYLAVYLDDYKIMACDLDYTMSENGLIYYYQDLWSDHKLAYNYAEEDIVVYDEGGEMLVATRAGYTLYEANLALEEEYKQNSSTSSTYFSETTAVENARKYISTACSKLGLSRYHYEYDSYSKVELSKYSATVYFTVYSSYYHSYANVKVSIRTNLFDVQFVGSGFW